MVNEKILKTSTGVMVSMVLKGRQTWLESVLITIMNVHFRLHYSDRIIRFRPVRLYQGPLLPFEQPFPNQELHLFSVRFLFIIIQGGSHLLVLCMAAKNNVE